MLNYDALLNIFHHYRLEDVDAWNLRLAWCKLTHVCRRWRYLIYDSSSVLDMCLPFNGSFSTDLLAHLPPLPLIIHYLNKTTTRVQKYEEIILPRLQQHGRLRSVALQAPSPGLCTLLETMNGHFPILENLSLLSTTEEEANIVLPCTFRAPNLRHLALHGVGLASGLSLFTSTTALVTLTLTHIPAPYSFPPGHLVAQLQGLRHLEELSIGLADLVPIPNTEEELLLGPIPRVMMPLLKRLVFRGEAAYLENFITQINAPLLDQLTITLFFELAFTLTNLTQLIHTNEELVCLSARILLNKDCVSIVTSNAEPRVGLTLNVSCEPLDWQIDSAAQVCGALEQVLSAVEELTLDLDEDGIPSGWETALDGSLWHELLLPFSSVKKLHIGSSLTSELSHALKPISGGLILELLPELQDLEVQLEIDDASRAFSTFIETRKHAGRLVRLLVRERQESQQHPQLRHIHLPPPMRRSYAQMPHYDSIRKNPPR